MTARVAVIDGSSDAPKLLSTMGRDDDISLEDERIDDASASSRVSLCVVPPNTPGSPSVSVLPG